MRGLQTLDVESLSPAAKMGTISSMISQTYSSRWSVRPLGSPSAPIAVGGSTAGGLTVARAQLLPLSLINAPTGDSRDPKYYVYTANQNQTVKLEGRKPLYLQPNEILVLASSLPLEILVSHSYTTTALIFEGALFREYIPDPEPIIGRRLSFACGLESVLNAMIESVWSMSDTGVLDQMAPKLLRGFLELLSSVDTGSLPEDYLETQTALDIRRAQIKAYIDNHFATSDVSVASIARALQLSERYVQLAFSGSDMTPSGYLRRCRLNACARLLVDPRWARRSITDIGFACGFNSSAHLSTEFKRTFGVSPRDYRRGLPVSAASN